jgi:hypothetical protein
MTADNEQVTSTDASAHAATQLRRGANSTSRVEPGTGPVTGVNGRGSSVPALRVEGDAGCRAHAHALESCARDFMADQPGSHRRRL